MKKISVIVPVYNVENYLAKCLDSLVNQTLKDIEIIIVNDGSTDGSQKIIDQYAKKYFKIIKSYVTKNGGQGAARNFGLKNAQGEYIAYVDSDDYVAFDMFEKMYNLAHKENSDIVICGNNFVTETGKIIKTETINNYPHVDLNIIFGQMAVWNKIYRKDLLLKNKLAFRSRVWYEDIDFSAKLLFDDVKISFLNEQLYNYVLRLGSTMNNTNIDRNLEILQAFDEMIKYFKTNKIFNKIYPKLEMLAIYHIYICGITRVIRIKAENKHKNEIINTMVNYLKINFPTYQNNKYLKYLDKRKKIIYNLVECKNYWLIRLIFIIKK